MGLNSSCLFTRVLTTQRLVCLPFDLWGVNKIKKGASDGMAWHGGMGWEKNENGPEVISSTMYAYACMHARTHDLRLTRAVMDRRAKQFLRKASSR